MARRQTKRERRELAKRERLAAQKRAVRQRKIRRLYSLGTILLAITVITFLIQKSGEGERKAAARLNSLATQAGCGTLQKPAIEGSSHVQEGVTVQYRTSPPTSGNHFGGGVSNTGVIATPVQSELQVHNLEHGHVGIQYKPTVSQAIQTALNGVAQKDNTYVFAAPNPIMQPTVAFNAWTRLITCDNPTDPAKLAAVATEFAKQFRNKGPEKNLPGTPNSPGA